jgi:hypothetical protein
MYKNKPLEYRQEMGYFSHHPASFDSGLGSSFASFPSAKDFRLQMDSAKQPKPAVTPVKIEKPAEDPFGTSVASKSWSDWVDEDEEEEERERMEREKELKRRSWSDMSDPGYEDDGYDVEWVGGGWDDLTV